MSWEAASHLFTFLATPASQSIVDGRSQARTRPDRDGDRRPRPADRAVLGRRVRARQPRDGRRARRAAARAARRIGHAPSGQRRADRRVPERRHRLERRRRHDGGPGAGSREDVLDWVRGGRIRRAPVRPRGRRARSAPTTTTWSSSPTSVQIVEDLTWYLDEPFGDTSAIPTYMVSKLAAEHVKVVLSGDGGDELFAGLRQVRRRRPRTPVRQGAGRPAARRWAPSAHAMPEGMRGRQIPAASRARRSRALPRRLDAVPSRADAQAVSGPRRSSRCPGTIRWPTRSPSFEPAIRPTGSARFSTATCRATCRSTSSPRSIG